MYPFNEIEAKWQRFWEENKTFRAVEDESVPKNKRSYILDMFPYPSAAGLHVGHPEGYTASDIYARFLRMRGFNVLHPMGFDSFGLPAENYAIKTKTHPSKTTNENIENFTRQIKALGFSYDWERCISTCDEKYYKWTQWIFLRLFEKGLAYESNTPINWCTACKTGLANEEVKDGKCERCGNTVEKKPIRQWVLKITEYAERLLSDLEELDWSESVKAMQRNWIGKSTGCNVRFRVLDEKKEKTDFLITVYTTRVDTIYGVTYLVLSPEHELVNKITKTEQKDAVASYVKATNMKSDLERTDLAKEKTGVFTGAYAENPITGSVIPIWISDYVLTSYGTGAVMAVPSHDERDFEFAKKFSLPLIKVVAGKEEIASLKNGNEKEGAKLLLHSAKNIDEYKKLAKENPKIFSDVSECTSAKDGYSINSGEFSGKKTEDAIKEITAYLEKTGRGKACVNYKLRNWIFSRQRYWGEPIPLVHCEKCGVVPVKESDLPLTLPDVKSYEPTGTGESPLAAIESFVNTTCPKCGGKAKRETNTMPQWAGSCWYYLRYLDAHNDFAFAGKEKIEYWMPVDLYVGGAEHAVLHLLYARFWHKVLYDLGLVNTKEPFTRLINQGMITSFAFQRKNKSLVPTDEVTEKDGKFFEAATGEELTQIVAKMSKSLKNIVNPDEQIAKYGADSVRLYEMFMGPLTMSKPWSTQGIVGINRFLDKVYSLSEKPLTSDFECSAEVNRLYAKTVQKVTKDTKNLDFNTAISQMMILTNELQKTENLPKKLWEDFVKILSPYAPHLAEELWQKMGHTKTIAYEKWPTLDFSLLEGEEKVIVVMINGKKKATFQVPSSINEAEMEEKAKNESKIQSLLNGKTIKKVIIVKDKLVNFVVS